MSNILTFDELPNEVARQGAILEQIQTLLNKIVSAPNQPKEEFLGIDEASKYLGIAKATLYVKVSRREVPSIRRGKRLYFSTEDLNNYLKGGKRESKEELNQIAQIYCNKKGGYNG